jgi:hypothetical protein
MHLKKDKRFTFSLFGLLLVLAIIALLSACFTPTQAQLTPTTYPDGAPNFNTPDNFATPLTLTNGQAVAFPANGTNSLEKVIRQDHGLSVFVTVISSNGIGGNDTLTWDVTPDSTVYTTTHPFSWTFPTAASAPATLTTNVYWTNWPAAVLNNVRGIQLTGATNALVGGGPTTNSVTLKLSYSQSGNQP